MQPFLRKLIKEKFKNSNFIQRNGVYLGNNQFLTKQKIFILEKIFNNIFIIMIKVEFTEKKIIISKLRLLLKLFIF